MLIDFRIPKNEIDSNAGDFDEKIYNAVQKLFDKTNDGTYLEWDIHDVTEEPEEYIVSIKALTESDIVKKEPVNNNVETTEIKEDILESLENGKSIAYNGPWQEKVFEMDIAQVAAFFEVVQFCDYMVKKTQMITPVAARSLQECQKYILDNLTQFDASVYEKPTTGSPDQPIEIKIKDEFAEHLKKWQEESVAFFEKLVADLEKKPQIVQATMLPKEGFDPRGPGLRL